MDTISNSYNQILANYFASKSLYLDEPTQKKPNTRKLVEQPWQQTKSGNFDELEKTLTDVEIFLALSDKDRFEIWRYWQSIPSEKSDFVTKYLEVIKNWREILGKTKRFELALNELSHFFFVSDKKDDSLKLFEEVFQLAKSLYQEGDIRLAIRQNNLGACYVHKQDWSKALELFESARPVYIKELGINHSDTWILLEGIAVCLVHTNRSDEGIEELKRCLEFNRKISGDHSYATAGCMYNLADAYTNHDELSIVISLFQKALDIYEIKLGIDHPQTIDCKVRLEDWLKLSELQKKSFELEQVCKFSESLKAYIIFEDFCAEMQTKSLMASCLFGKAKILRILDYELDAIIEAKMALKFAKDSNNKLIDPIEKFIIANLKGNNIDSLEKSYIIDKNLLEIYLNAASELGNISSSEFIRRLALRSFEMNDFQTTEVLLNRLLDKGFEMASTYIHLSRLFLMTGQFSKCYENVSNAWDIKSEAKPYVIARLLWLKIVLCSLNNEQYQNLFGQLKTALLNEDATMEWTMQPVLDQIKPQMTEHQYIFFSALLDALNDKQYLEKLNDCQEWRDAKPCLIE